MNYQNFNSLFATTEKRFLKSKKPVKLEKKKRAKMLELVDLIIVKQYK